MPCIPDAYTDSTPAAVEFNGRLYVAYKDNDRGLIQLAWTDTPDDESSWEILDLTFSFPGDGPEVIRTSCGPALSVHADQLWLSFKGHDNPNIWLIAMDRDGTWSGHGALEGLTSNPPAMNYNMVVFRGDRADNHIRYTRFMVVPPPEEEIPSTRSNTGPAIARWTEERGEAEIVAYTSRSDVMVTHYRFSPGIGWAWTSPMPIQEVRSDSKPGLAMHRDWMFLAYKQLHRPEIGLSIYAGNYWIDMGTLPGYLTSEGPALVNYHQRLAADYRQRLYVVYREANTGEVWYGPVPVPDTIPEALTVMTLNVRIHPLDPWRRGEGDEHPNHWQERLPRIITMLQCYIERQGLHIIGMQEVRPRQYDDLRELLPEYESIYETRGGFMQGREGVALFYRSDRVELLDWGERVMSYWERKRRSGCPWMISWGNWPNRNIIWGHFRDRSHLDRSFYVFNTHFGGDECHKESEALIMAELIAGRDHAADPVIAMGDFNTGQQADGMFEVPFTTLRREAGLENAYRTIHPFYVGQQFASGNRHYGNKRCGRMIDLVLVSPSFRVFNADIDRTMFTEAGSPAIVPCNECHLETGYCEDLGGAYAYMYSDHWAVWAGLGWPTD